MSANVFGKNLTRYLGRGGVGKIVANAAGVLQIANKCGGVAELAAGTYTVPTLESGQEMFYFFVKATGAVVLTNVGNVSSGNTVLVAQDGAGWTILGNGLLTEKLVSSYGHVDIPLPCFREVDADGDVRAAADAAAAGSGGILASDTTPIYEGAGTTNALRLNWATGNVDRIAASVTLPRDFDGSANCQIGVVVASEGTTDDFGCTVVTNWDGGADITDTMVDVVSSDVHRTEVTVAAADMPDAPMSVSVSFTPPAHAADAYYLYGVYIRYQKKLVEA